MTENRPEILAPAGTYEALEAAVNAGANAVYLGGDMFSARAFAGNFSEEELLKALDFCHLFDVKVYMTVNTLFKEDEIGFLIPYMEPYYKAGLDAVLVQDYGAVSVLKEAYPDLPLHASTQMSVSSRYGAAFLKELGFTRIVPARELSLEEITLIKNSVEIEIETFVHGAMCFAYSGKCLFSSFMGGRSGNRGRCAQPCRQYYVPEGAAGAHIMSLKDMCTLEVLPELIDSGIDSFKIEGRMKNAQYVAAVVHAYKAAVELYQELRGQNLRGDCREPFQKWDANRKAAYFAEAERLKKDMMDIYNRGGFCDGYYHKEKGPQMFAADRPNHTGLKIGTVEAVKGADVKIRLCEAAGKGDVVEIRTGKKAEKPQPRSEKAGGHIIELTCSAAAQKGELLSLKGKELKRIRPGMEVFRTRNQTLLDAVEKQLIEKERLVSAKIETEAVVGKPLTITISGAGISVTVTGPVVEKAQARPVTIEQLDEKMRRTKGTHLALETAYQMEEDVFFSMSEFNALRRKAMEQFKAAMAGRYCREETI